MRPPPVGGFGGALVSALAVSDTVSNFTGPGLEPRPSEPVAYYLQSVLRILQSKRSKFVTLGSKYRRLIAICEVQQVKQIRLRNLLQLSSFGNVNFFYKNI